MSVKDDRSFTGGRRFRTRRTAFGRTSLPFLAGVYVWVSRIEEEAVQGGLDRDRMKAEVEYRLAASGIPVYHQPHSKRTGVPTTPCLGVLLHLRKSDVVPPGYVFSLEVFFVQSISSEDEPADHQNLRMTWSKEAIGDIPAGPQGADWSGVYSHVGTLVKAFISDYLSLNSRAKPALLIN